MDSVVLEDCRAVAKRAADIIAAAARDAVAARGRFVVALSGGRTPWTMLRCLAHETLPWASVHIVQVDERVAPAGDPERNLTRLRQSLEDAPLRDDRLHAMPVELDEPKLAIDRYAATLESLAGSPAVLDLVHLGLGSDGHTASLVPGDAVLEINDSDVAFAGPYQGTKRMTLTYPIINRARRILWVVTGAEKSTALKRLCAGDREIPAGRVQNDNALLLADRAASASP
jgi:6-phosphogluconolactonase